MNEVPTARQLADLGFAHHSVREIIVEGFKLIRKLDTDSSFQTFDVWAPSVRRQRISDNLWLELGLKLQRNVQGLGC